MSERTEEYAAARHRERERSAWIGWIWFGAVMLVLLGLFTVIFGLVALFQENYYVVGPEGLLVFDLTGWGWIHLILGALATAAGFALFSGAAWARVTAVVLAALNAISQFAFLPAYPVWSLIAIALDVLVMWAIVVHGRELGD
ncbi:hypothetical protein V5P93_003223 [Actinokineospora auranticolor]|uniref:DUF7144 domain-containing protein n=1 Tax=Actinokineospora auranticolor TaxID=155976 RepID=A0A2S6H1I7_9PSEU|nr:hypothetical protein [Actinokineospora auranticolor]PPK71358.1 hypothetical protein CLV40_101548 [Actinokineospora auranticolor]